MQLPIDINTIKGFLDPQEGAALHEHCLATAALGPCLEVGSYCGKSTVYLGAAAKKTNSIVYAVDHHRGSEEHQKVRKQMFSISNGRAKSDNDETKPARSLGSPWTTALKGGGGK